MHNFVYLAQLRSQEFSCEPNFGGGHAPPLGCASGRDRDQRDGLTLDRFIDPAPYHMKVDYNG